MSKIIKKPTINNAVLRFISRHEPNNGQQAIARELGYMKLRKTEVVFTDDPVNDLISNGIAEKTMAIVAPSHITNKLLNEGYTLVEFVNSPVKREKMVFCCEGAYVYRLPEITEELMKAVDHAFQYALVENTPNEFKFKEVFGRIEQEYIPCPISIDDQYESSLIPEKK